MSASTTIVVDDLHLPSSDGRHTIAAKMWKVAAMSRPRGIVQIVHGMEEHIGRYDDFARFLASRGWAVVGHDQLGHGDTCPPGERGVFDPKRGRDQLLADIHAVRLYAAGTMPPALAHFVFGHSMGSYLTRAYLARHASGLSGAVLCGTGHVAPIVSRAGNLLARGICAVRGPAHKSALLASLCTGAFARRVSKTDDLAWISADEGNIARYRADGACGFGFAASGYAVLTDITREACSTETLWRVPRDIPLLFIAGEGDPVGDMGAGVERSAREARTAGIKDVEVKVYAGMRHEILNEADHGKVYADVATWLDRRLAAQGS